MRLPPPALIVWRIFTSLVVLLAVCALATTTKTIRTRIAFFMLVPPLTNAEIHHKRAQKSFSTKRHKGIKGNSETRLRRRVGLIRAQGWSASDNPGTSIKKSDPTLKGFVPHKPFQG